ncbi:CPBP family intramembrane glutamic endopeptidase [Halosimplex pelagicum]|uniref:CPBP family intramembrane metalloprotease n=1 Tax=Halosimplex pelagicum TaxID=869886 RepID=A0A7D5T2C8_9EURY|nr:type II CAAX endopeptidase family protein [Halosimplex pelagicum]QLH81071.1 CPBP family intramembrane metalloprotease [Halosimplex pelagicum]
MGDLPAATQMGSEYYRVADMETRVESLFHSIALVVLAFIAGTFLLAGAGSVLGALGFDVESMATLPPLAYAALTATQFVGFFAVIGLYLGWRSDEQFFRAAVPSLRDLGWVVAGFVGLFAIASALSAVIQAAGVDTATNQVITQGQRDPVRFLYLIPVTFLFVAPAEELLFRGIVQGLFRRAYGAVPAVVLASAVFGAMHYFALLGSDGSIVSSLALAAALGVVLGAVYELTENIVVPIVVHGCWNTMSFLLQYFQATGVV